MEGNGHFCAQVTSNQNTPLTLGGWIVLYWCLLLSLDSEGTPEVRLRHNIANLKMWVISFLVFPGRLWWPQSCDIHNLPCFSNLSFFFLLCWLSGTLVFWLIHHSPGYFPSWNCSQQMMNECSALTLPRAKGMATIRTTTFRVWWIWAFTEIFITPPSLPLELNLSQAVFNLIYFLKQKKKVANQAWFCCSDFKLV